MIKKKLTLVVSMLLVTVLVLGGCAANSGSNDTFANWTQDSEVLQELTDYVETVTEKSSPDFIPVEERIAVFDLNGTLFCELFPTYFEWCMFIHRVLDDPDYNAPEDMRAVANELVKVWETGVVPEELEKQLAEYATKAFAGMTVEEYMSYAKDMLNTPAERFRNLMRKDAFYLPMLEVVSYLSQNEFTIYIVSGTDRMVVRAIIDGTIDVPKNRVIGMDVNIIASGQGSMDGLAYVMTDDDKLVRGDKLIIKSGKMNKVSLIAQEIGMQPVLAFGNSTGDISMAQYVTNNNPHRSAAFMLVNDDDVREHGDAIKAQKMRENFESYGWNVISMKNDFANIYPKGVEAVH